MMRIGGIVFGILLAVVAVAMAQSADQMFDGAFAFHRMCSDCHGASGQGVTLFGPPLAGDAFITASGDNAIAYVINNGRKYRDKMYPAYSGMPKFQFITGGELQALIDHLKGPLQKSAK
jgi:mono/diheme cytochrome c family protein